MIYFLIKYPKNFPEPFSFILKIVAATEFIGLILLLAGNYNLGKYIITLSIIALFLSYLLIANINLMRDLYNYSEYLKNGEEKENLAIHTTGYREPNLNLLLYIFVGFGMFFLMFRSSFWYQNFSEPIFVFFTEERSVGDFSFNYNHIFLFFIILVIAAFVSKLVSFLSTDQKSGDGKNTFGSWLLLIRILIISLGVVFAFAIAGFPLDRLTIILSALSVGIGLGLQNITNNLVSGLILAFEKPFNIGDVIEVEDQIGKVKSVSVRSSIIKTFAGTQVVIPNGNLLSKNLTNYSTGNPKIRFEIKFGVAYGTDLKLVKNTIKDILDRNKDVLLKQNSVIWISNFNDSSIEFTIKFWVMNFNLGNDVKTDLIIEIDKKFKEKNIKIAFPQQEIFIKNFPENFQSEQNK